MRVIPIAPAVLGAVEGAGCEEQDGQVRKLDLPLARREFLKGSGILIGMLATGSVIASLAPSPVWALELKQLSKSEGETLMAMGRTLYPHKKLPDAVYALLAKDLDAKAAGSADAASMMRAGIAGLDSAAGGSFVKASPAKRLAVVKGIEGTPFFANSEAPGRDGGIDCPWPPRGSSPGRSPTCRRTVPSPPRSAPGSAARGNRRGPPPARR